MGGAEPTVCDLLRLLVGRRVAVLTGAGISTDSGIPDYRGPDSPPSNPMTIAQFTGDPAFRQRYWARNHIGWRHMADTAPNLGHVALAALEEAGVVNGVITQNVDLLHTKAGSRRVVDLHGSYATVVCLSCGKSVSRALLAERLEELNPGFLERAERLGGIAVAPDADAVVSDTASFRFVDCRHCGGILKPDIVYFGESVPKDRVAQAYSVLDEADALLVAGSSLTVYSGFRFVRHAAARGIPVGIVNRGTTRGDELATVKIDGGCSAVLALLASELVPAVQRGSTEESRSWDRRMSPAVQRGSTEESRSWDRRISPAVQRGSTEESRSWDRRMNPAVQRGSTEESRSWDRRMSPASSAR